MAVPKRKMSRNNTRHRRAQWKASAPELVTITIDGRAHRVPRRLAPAYRRGLLRADGAGRGRPADES
ncbi:50S ribosomal protein L32 [Streptomyces malaysiensis]|uniref:50S ribosomal protein L32 n=1 Tax=Streptomyces malaysiensis TaxID=92644 RepID=UPI0011CD7B84|nr:50S ribosomal protein L32 [Streptomyces malaysiensis]